jgi:hypothetical protein
MTSSSPPLDPSPSSQYPLITPKTDEEEKKKDWAKIGAIAAAVIGGLIVALGYLCFTGNFPRELLGGSIGCGLTMIVGGAILIPAAFVLFRKFRNSEFCS